MAAQRSKPPVILIADDDEFVREHLHALMAGTGAEVRLAEDGAAAIEQLGQPLDLAIVDLDMPKATGLEVLAVAASKAPALPIIMLSGAGEVEDAVTALKRGAFDYLTKPFDAEELLARMREALRVSNLESENASLRAAQSASPEPIRFIAEAPASRALLEAARRSAAVDSTVLITGPSGTGKSVLARYIHQHSTRGSGPFIAVNCGALPRELIESELFGHEKGAFTGATSARTGRFEAAAGGTIFLDEVGELPLDLQPKLLNVIQDRAVTRLGSTKAIPVNARIVAATNRDLTLAVAEKEFREDLFYRLNVLNLELPALRERPEDILPFAHHSVERIAARLGIPAPRLTADADEKLQVHSWPGNVRELENVIERALVFADGGEIGADDLGTLSAPAARMSDTDLAGVPLAELERRAILATLAACDGSRVDAARVLGVSERTIYNRLREYRIDADAPAETPAE